MKAEGSQYIIIGFALVVFGAVVPFLMVLGMIANSFWLSILAYSASVVGLFLGVFGAFDIRQEELDK
jgi:hypothetical protein